MNILSQKFAVMTVDEVLRKVHLAKSLHAGTGKHCFVYIEILTWSLCMYSTSSYSLD